jgi:hypothetical protein
MYAIVSNPDRVLFCLLSASSPEQAFDQYLTSILRSPHLEVAPCHCYSLGQALGFVIYDLPDSVNYNQVSCQQCHPSIFTYPKVACFRLL